MPRVSGDSQSSTPLATLWTVLKYGALIYFNILVLAFFIVHYVATFCLCALQSPLSNIFATIHSRKLPIKRSFSTASVPGLDYDTDGSITPRTSGEWDVDWDDLPQQCATTTSRKPRRNFCDTSYDSCRLWEDDDGYSSSPRRTSSMIFESIAEEE